MKRIVIAMIMLLAFAGTSKAQDEYKYDIKIIKPLGVKGFVYQDQFVKITFIPLSNLTFILENKTAKTIEIDWQKVSFVDIYGRADRVMHEGVRYIERDKAIPPTVIPPTANIQDTIVPVGFVSYDSSRSESWEIRKLYEGGMDKYVDKPFSLLFPIKIGAVTKSYFFTFVVKKEKKVVAASEKIKSADLIKKPVSKQMYGDKWVFKFDSGELACYPPDGSVFFITNGIAYALNGYASGKYIDGVKSTAKLFDVLEFVHKGAEAIALGAELCKLR